MIKMDIKNHKIPITLDVKDYIGIYTPEGIETYEGDYAVIPKKIEQELYTKNKMMKDNVTVQKIPYHEVSNETGITVVIGGIL